MTGSKKHRDLFEEYQGQFIAETPSRGLGSGSEPRVPHLRRECGGYKQYPYERTTQWCIVGPWDTRGYRFFLQWVRGDARGVMVRVGCRFYTLDAANKHWHGRAGRNSSREARAIIDLMLAQAKTYGLPGIKRTTLKPERNK